MTINKKNYYKQIAAETLEVINKGYYINEKGETVIIKKTIEKAVNETELVLDHKEIQANIKQNNKKYLSFHSNISVINDTVINTIINVRGKVEKENIIALNFASAKNPGGGFLNGANAQEESIVRASALYKCLIKNNEFYKYHRLQNNPLYTDRMIYSPNVPVFRSNEGYLLLNPVECSFITSSAVNAKVARKRGIVEETIEKVMDSRINKILTLMLKKEPKTIILGAFGCGVFENNPDMVSKIFASNIRKKLELFDNINIVFAIPDKSGELIKIFKDRLNFS